MLNTPALHLTALFLLQLACVSSEWAHRDSKWDESSSGVQLLFDLDVKTSMWFVDGNGPSDQVFIDRDGQIHSDFLPEFRHPKMLLYTAVRSDLFDQGHSAWVPIMSYQISQIQPHHVSSKQYEVCWYSTNVTTQVLRSGGIHNDQVTDTKADFIGCYHLSVDFQTLFVEPAFKPMLKHECWQKYAHLDICNTHTITVWNLESIVDDVDPVVPQENDTGSSFVRLHIGSVYRIKIKLTFEFLHDDASVATVEKNTASLVVFRNKINFVYLVQHDGFCNISHLRHSDAEALVVQWKEEHDCLGCFFFPNSTVNEGRNELWYRTFEKWPGTVFTYYIFLDGDASLTLRPDRNKLSPVPNASRESLPFRVFEQHLLHYRPAIAVPFYSQWHLDNGSDVQFVSNFDHIFLAVHANVARMFLPSETIFDQLSWWWAQRVWGFLCSVAFPQQTLQINAVMSDNDSLRLRDGSEKARAGSGVCGMRDSSITTELNPQSEPPLGTKKYMKNNRFEQVFLWFMASLKKQQFSSSSRDIQTNLHSPEPSSRDMLQPVKSDGQFEIAKLGGFIKIFDFLHPYWLNRTFLFIENRTFTGYLSVCVFFSGVGLTSKESCKSTFDSSDIASAMKFQAEMVVLLMNSNQMLVEQNREMLNSNLMLVEQNQEMMRRIDALEKHSKQ